MFKRFFNRFAAKPVPKTAVLGSPPRATSVVARHARPTVAVHSPRAAMPVGNPIPAPSSPYSDATPVYQDVAPMLVSVMDSIAGSAFDASPSFDAPSCDYSSGGSDFCGGGGDFGGGGADGGW